MLQTTRGNYHFFEQVNAFPSIKSITMDEQYHDTSVPLPGKALPSQSSSQSSPEIPDIRNEDSRQEPWCFREGATSLGRDLTHVEDIDDGKSSGQERPTKISRKHLPYLDELKLIQSTRSKQEESSTYPIPHLVRGQWEDMMRIADITESSSAAEDDTPFIVKEFIRNNDENGATCPQIPALDHDSSSVSSQQEKVNLLLRSFAWSQDSIDQGRSRVRLSSSNDDTSPAPWHKFHRAESLLATQSEREESSSPTSTWVYWEEKIVDPLHLNSEEEN